MFLLYLFTYAIAFFRILRIFYCVILLLIITFIFLEYLTEDTKKLSLVVKLTYKIYDYIFMMIFQYHLLWIFFAFLLLHSSHYDNAYITQVLLKAGSIISLFIGIHLSISQPFKIKTITEMCTIFEKIPVYSFEYQEKMQEKFDLLCALEDKTYFQRKKSYSCITFEYINCFVKNHWTPPQKISLKVLSNIRYLPKFRLLNRGYSTPEMQLIRTIGIVRGYEKHRIQRKIFEIIYSKVFFSSLKEYHEANTYLTLPHYRHYLLYIYFQTVMTKINEKKCTPLASAFQNDNDVSNWSMNGLFIACLGLSFRKVNDYNLTLFGDVISNFNLDMTRIKELNENYPSQKFPSADR